MNNFKINNIVSEEYTTRVTSMSKSLIDHVLGDFGGKIDCKVNVRNSAISDHKLSLGISRFLYKFIGRGWIMKSGLWITKKV